MERLYRNVGTLELTLEKAPEVFETVGVNLPINVLFRMVNDGVLESLLLLPYLPPNARVADVGSGAGLPIIPVLIARPDVHATLIESSKKKAVFLREALNLTQTSDQATVLAERFENVPAPMVDCVTCRALDRFATLLPRLIRWSPQPNRLLLFGGEKLRKQIERAGLEFLTLKIPDSQRRFLFVIKSEPPAVAGG